MKQGGREGRLRPWVTPAGAWALSLGTAIGWGSLAVTGNDYLMQAGPLGSILGTLLGAVVMLVIARNYHFLMNLYPGPGGVYTYAKEQLGYDSGFLAGWFVLLTYAAVFWANATALPLFARYFLGDVFRFVKLYNLFGYDVYLGEVLLSLAAMFGTVLFCTHARRSTQRAMIVMGVLITVIIAVCLGFALAGHQAGGFSFRPGFLEKGSRLNQVILIACISPWAFIGFENISHMSGEFAFSRTKSFRIFAVTLTIVTLLYISVFLLSVSAYPPEFSGWVDYLSHLDELSGIKGVPAFYAVKHYMGDAGVWMMALCMMALVGTSMIGNSAALSRLLYALGQDKVLPERFARLNSRGIPARSYLLATLISLPIPFLGRTAVGWIVDVSTIGATITYGFLSYMALRAAREKHARTEQWTGTIGTILMAAMLAYMLIPNLYQTGSMAKESYLIFTLWGVLGFLFFRNILERGKSGELEKSLIVWFILLLILLLVALIWVNQTMMATTEAAVENLETHLDRTTGMITVDHAAVHAQMTRLRTSNTRTVSVVVVMFLFSMTMVLLNYRRMNKTARENEVALGNARHAAYTDSLTRVKNKHAFCEWEQRLDGEIAGKNAEPFAAVFCDLNGLKHVNDTYGHTAGDVYLCRACRVICKTFAHSPVFRVGGDEFAVILRGDDFLRREELMAQLDAVSVGNIGKEQEPVIAAGMEDFDAARDTALRNVFERADAKMYVRKQELKDMGARIRE